MQARRALIFVGLSVLRNLLGLVSSVFCWGWCSPFVGLSVLRNMLGLVGFPVFVPNTSVKNAHFVWKMGFGRFILSTTVPLPDLDKI